MLTGCALDKILNFERGESWYTIPCVVLGCYGILFSCFSNLTAVGRFSSIFFCSSNTIMAREERENTKLLFDD